MTCREFERKFNELLDGEGEAAAQDREMATTGPCPTTTELERTLFEHAGHCPACHDVAARYQSLRRALHTWNFRPVVPVDLADRILAADASAGTPASSTWAIVRERRPRELRRLVFRWVSLAAACSLALAFLPWLRERERRNPPMPPAASVGPANELHSIGGTATAPLADSRVLHDALAEATSATFDLARSASEHAARISRQMLDAATEPELRSGDTALPRRAAEVSVTMPTLTSFTSDAAAAGAMLQDVGDRVASGIGPLTETARHAFGFLLGPPPAKLEGRKISPVAKGA